MGKKTTYKKMRLFHSFKFMVVFRNKHWPYTVNSTERQQKNDNGLQDLENTGNSMSGGKIKQKMLVKFPICTMPKPLQSRTNLNNFVSRLLDALSFATRATAWPGKPFSVVKHIPAHNAS